MCQNHLDFLFFGGFLLLFFYITMFQDALMVLSAHTLYLLLSAKPSFKAFHFFSTL